MRPCAWASNKGSRALVEERMNECGDEDGLAGARKAGDAEPQGRIAEAAGEILEAARRDAGAVDDV